MALSTRYHPGGFISGASAQNRAEEWNSSGNTYTAWDATGNQTVQRALTIAEQANLVAQDAAAAATANQAALQSRAQAALTANATFLALGSPTNAQVVAQVQRLTKECNALIRLALSATADISDTA